MNFIQQLKANLAQRDQTIDQAQQQVTDFIAFLHSDKFTGTDNGDRKDWISTSDVVLWLQNLRSTLQEK